MNSTLKRQPAIDTQIGGDHYKKFKIQPIEFIVHNKLDFLQGCIIKRICRYNKVGGKGLEDLKKIKHEVDLIIELAETDAFKSEQTINEAFYLAVSKEKESK